MAIIWRTNKISEWVVRGDFLLLDLHSKESERMLMDEDMFSFERSWVSRQLLTRGHQSQPDVAR